MDWRGVKRRLVLFLTRTPYHTHLVSPTRAVLCVAVSSFPHFMVYRYLSCPYQVRTP